MLIIRSYLMSNQFTPFKPRKTMAFKLEWLDEEARNRLKLDVSNWAVDHERDMALWSKLKHWQQRAEGDYTEDFFLRIGRDLFVFHLMPAEDFWDTRGKTHHEYVWNQIISYEPSNLHNMAYSTVIVLLKEALAAYGGSWYPNQNCLSFSVSFKF
jgi:hypothetical protein